ncbi:MAG: c-type cytochrome [Henriciella sp.]
MNTYRNSFAPAMAGFAALSLSACGATESTPGDQSDTFELSETEMIESGREIVEAQCVMCHAIGLNDTSPRPDAPPLRTVLASYPPDMLAEDFREQVHVGHPDMPDFEFGPIGTDHVIAYLISIQDADGLIE